MNHEGTKNNKKRENLNVSTPLPSCPLLLRVEGRFTTKTQRALRIRGGKYCIISSFVSFVTLCCSYLFGHQYPFTIRLIPSFIRTEFQLSRNPILRPDNRRYVKSWASWSGCSFSTDLFSTTIDPSTSMSMRKPDSTDSPS